MLANFELILLIHGNLFKKWQSVCNSQDVNTLYTRLCLNITDLLHNFNVIV